jgi:hypothetical protein
MIRSVMATIAGGEECGFQISEKSGKKKPNPWGAHDILGNVLEWTLDQYDPTYYRKLARGESLEQSLEAYPHSARGGSWDDDKPENAARAARRASDKSWKIQDPQLPKSIWYHTDAQCPRPSRIVRHAARQPTARGRCRRLLEQRRWRRNNPGGLKAQDGSDSARQAICF